MSAKRASLYMAPSFAYLAAPALKGALWQQMTCRRACSSISHHQLEGTSGPLACKRTQVILSNETVCRKSKAKGGAAAKGADDEDDDEAAGASPLKKRAPRKGAGAKGKKAKEEADEEDADAADRASACRSILASITRRPSQALCSTNS